MAVKGEEMIEKEIPKEAILKKIETERKVRLKTYIWWLKIRGEYKGKDKK